jgi:hypothetical protein
MGSHGGALASGQKAVSAGYGITEEAMGCPIRATMETIRVGTSEHGLPVFVDKYACEADGIIVICRVKPHTAFSGKYESGMLKMLTIGLGKQKGDTSVIKYRQIIMGLHIGFYSFAKGKNERRWIEDGS